MDNKAGNFSDIKQIQQYYYDRKEKLGQGSYGSVYLGHSFDDPSKTFAIKVIPVSMVNNDPELQENLFNEMKVMMLLNNENIIRCYDVVSTINNHYFILEYCSGGTLAQYLKEYGKLSEPEALRILIQILKGYYDMLTLGIIHRDLKPENILISDGIFKLADFGFAKCLENFKKDVLKSLVGTPFYMSPQILQGRDYNTKTDLWSIALIYYEMLVGRLPWTAKFHAELLQKILTQPITIPNGIIISKKSKDFLSGALKIDESKRFSWDDVFCHEFFNDAFGYRAKKNKLRQQALNYQTLLKERIIDLNIDLFKLFSEIDKNKNNQLEMNEFAELLKRLDRNASREQIEFVFNSIDEDGNNVISLYEFRKWLSNEVTKTPDKRFQKQQSLPYNMLDQGQNKIKATYENHQQILNFNRPSTVQMPYYPQQIPTYTQPPPFGNLVFNQPPIFNPPLIPPKPMNAPFNPNLPLRYSTGTINAYAPSPFSQQMNPKFGYGNPYY